MSKSGQRHAQRLDRSDAARHRAATSRGPRLNRPRALSRALPGPRHVSFSCRCRRGALVATRRDHVTPAVRREKPMITARDELGAGVESHAVGTPGGGPMVEHERRHETPAAVALRRAHDLLTRLDVRQLLRRTVGHQDARFARQAVGAAMKATAVGVDAVTKAEIRLSFSPAPASCDLRKPRARPLGPGRSSKYSTRLAAKRLRGLAAGMGRTGEQHSCSPVQYQAGPVTSAACARSCLPGRSAGGLARGQVLDETVFFPKS